MKKGTLSLDLPLPIFLEEQDIEHLMNRNQIKFLNDTNNQKTDKTNSKKELQLY